MPGQIARPPDMRDILYKWNWKTGYAIAGLAAVVLPIGFAWVVYKRKRYDAYFEKHRDPAQQEWVRQHTALTPQKYAAYIQNLQGEMAEIREKYQN